MADDIIQVQGQYYIRANKSLAETRSHVLKQDDCFAIFDLLGNMRPLGIRDHGLFRDDTRFLSRLVLDLESTHFLLLSSEVRKDCYVLAVDMTNPEITTSEGQFIGQNTVHILRNIFLWNNVYYEQMNIRNYGNEHLRLPFTFRYEADFADIFEVRGMHRSQRGNLADPVQQGDTIILGYHGLDGIQRETHLTISPVPDMLDSGVATCWVELAPQQQRTLLLTIACQYPAQPVPVFSYKQALQAAMNRKQRLSTETAHIETSNEHFNEWMTRSQNDLLMMLTETPYGLYPYAGIPWFSAIFGRDALIVALASLWWYPDIARGVLSYLAKHQALQKDPARDAEPGKILHEQRKGEMANTDEIPFGNYYGSIDGTPLFIVLAGHYYKHSGDQHFLQQLWPTVETALSWIDNYGDQDGDGFVEYTRKANGGLRNQGWKDSDDSIFYPDGTLVEGPLALCEIQGYVYEAKLLAATMAEALGHTATAQQLRQQAEELRQHFQQTFWCEEAGMYGLALDGNKQLCRVRSSNAAHCLFSGIASPAHAERIAQQIVSEDFFTGWGIRTVPEGEARYNPISYHNGSIWPHDNALISYGLSRYGYKEEAVKVLNGLFDASLFMGLKRLPELFCGFDRWQNEYPTLYPVACLPQAWASASILMLLQACLGITIDGIKRRVLFTSPTLPDWLEYVKLKNIRVGDGTVDIALYRHQQDVGINVERREGAVEIIVTK
jgi:glycogen debranching enzyme